MSSVLEQPTVRLLERIAILEKACRWYADPESHEAEYDGDTPIPDSSPVFWDGGKKAKRALQEAQA